MRAPAALRSLVSSSKKSKDAAAVPNSPSVPAHPRPEKSSGQSMPPLGAPLLPPSAFVGLLDNDDGSNFYPTPTSPRTETTMQDDYFRAENPFARSERARAGSLASSVGRGAAGPQSDTHAPPHSFAYEARASSPQLQASSEGHGDGGPSTRRVPSSPTPTSQQHFSGNTSSYSYPARGGTPVNNYPSSAATNPAATAPITSSASQPMAPSTSSSSRPRGRSFTSAAKKLFSRSKSRDREPSSDQNHSLSRSRSRASSGENDEYAAGNEDIPAVPPLPFQLSHQFNEERSSIRSRAGSGSTNAHGTSSVGGAHGAAEKFSFPPLGSPSLGRGSEDPFGAAFGSGSGSGNVTPTPPRPGTAGSGSTRSRAITAPSKYTPGSLSAALALTGEPDVDGVDPDHVEQIQQSNNPFMVPRALVLGHGSPSTPKQPPPPVPTASAHISAPTDSQQEENAPSMSAPNTVESTMMMIESDSEAFVPPPPPVPSNAVDAPSSSVVPESAVANAETGADFTLSLGISPVAGLDDSDVDTLALPPVPSLPPTPSVSTSFQGETETEAEVPEEPVISNAEETPLGDIEAAVSSPSSPRSLESEAEVAEEQPVESTGAIEPVAEPEADVAAIVPPPALDSSTLVEPQDVIESEERIAEDTATALAAPKPPTPTIEIEDVDVNLAVPTSEEEPHVDFTPAIATSENISTGDAEVVDAPAPVSEPVAAPVSVPILNLPASELQSTLDLGSDSDAASDDEDDESQDVFMDAMSRSGGDLFSPRSDIQFGDDDQDESEGENEDEMDDDFEIVSPTTFHDVMQGGVVHQEGVETHPDGVVMGRVGVVNVGVGELMVEEVHTSAVVENSAVIMEPLTLEEARSTGADTEDAPLMTSSSSPSSPTSLSMQRQASTATLTAEAATETANSPVSEEQPLMSSELTYASLASTPSPSRSPSPAPTEPASAPAPSAAEAKGDSPPPVDMISLPAENDVVPAASESDVVPSPAIPTELPEHSVHPASPVLATPHDGDVAAPAPPPPASSPSPPPPSESGGHSIFHPVAPFSFPPQKDIDGESIATLPRPSGEHDEDDDELNEELSRTRLAATDNVGKLSQTFVFPPPAPHRSASTTAGSSSPRLSVLPQRASTLPVGAGMPPSPISPHGQAQAQFLPPPTPTSQYLSTPTPRSIQFTDAPSSPRTPTSPTSPGARNSVVRKDSHSDAAPALNPTPNPKRKTLFGTIKLVAGVKKASKNAKAAAAASGPGSGSGSGSGLAQIPSKPQAPMPHQQQQQQRGRPPVAYPTPKPQSPPTAAMPQRRAQTTSPSAGRSRPPPLSPSAYANAPRAGGGVYRSPSSASGGLRRANTILSPTGIRVVVPDDDDDDGSASGSGHGEGNAMMSALMASGRMAEEESWRLSEVAFM